MPEPVKQQIRQQAKAQCGYCRSLQKYVLGILEIDHIIPTAAGGSDDASNLWLACRMCNCYKGTQTHGQDPLTNRKIKLFNPRTQIWQKHFTWDQSGTYILGLTATGRATVVALQLNNPHVIAVRQAWVSAGWHPPDQDLALFSRPSK